MLGSKIVLPIKGSSLREVGQIFSATKDYGVNYKIELPLILNLGLPKIFQALNNCGISSSRVLVDVNIYDLSQVVAESTKIISNLSPWMFTVPADSRESSISTAVENKGSTLAALRLSFGYAHRISKDEQQMVADILNVYVDKAVHFGIEALICSSLEFEFLSPKASRLKRIVSDVRPEWVCESDKMTPVQAVKLGADYVILDLISDLSVSELERTVERVCEGLTAVSA